MFSSINPELDRLAIKHTVEFMATKNSPIAYSALADRIGEEREKRPMDIALADPLGRIQEYCNELGLPTLSVMVVNKGTFLPNEKGFMPKYIEVHPEAEGSSFLDIVKKEKAACLKCKEWQRLYDYVGLDESVPEIRDVLAEHDAELVLKEGAKALKTITREVTERNPEARKRCLAKKGYRCVVCKRTSEEIYGIPGIVHVHHLNPLSESLGEREVDPERDLVPVCPSCHAAIHSKDPIYTPEELRAKMGEIAAKLVEKRGE